MKRTTVLSFFLLLSILSESFGQAKIRQLDSLFNLLKANEQINGYVLVAENGKAIYQKAFGQSDLEKHRLINDDTMFELASVSKQFTAMAIMQLEEKGKLNYDDNIKKFLPSLPYPDITVKHLLHHTSGIPDFLSWNEHQIDTKKINSNKDILYALEKNFKTLATKPGDYFAYSNTNYVLLALIVENISGLSFSKYLDTNIFKPLGMTNTAVYSRRSALKGIENYALGYVYEGRKGIFVESDSLIANSYVRYFDGVAGPYGISSTANDLLKWDNALYTESLVSKQSQEKGYIPATLNNGSKATLGGLHYGFGWLILPLDPETGTRYMHSGGYPGYHTIISRYPEKHKTIILLTNKWNVINIFELTGAIENILFEKPFRIPKKLPFQKSIQLSPAQVKAIEGTYSLKEAPQIKFEITSGLDRVYAQLTNQPKVEIYAESPNDFFYTIVEARLKFVADSNGVINRLILFQNGRELEAVKE